MLIIGAGQAGLAASHALGQRGVEHRVLDGHAEVGDSWRQRYAGLRLFTPRQFSSLPSMPMPGDAAGYPDRDEFADYLRDYARLFELPVRSNTRVTRLTRDVLGRFAVSLHSGEQLLAQRVIIAAGSFQQAVIPAVGAGLDSSVLQFTPDTIGDGSALPSGTLLVVGDGASGRDLARRYAATHRVLLACGKPRRLLPERLFGRSIWWWLQRLGLMRASADSLIGRRMRRLDPFPNRQASLADLQRLGVELVPRLARAEGRQVGFADGQQCEVDAAIWAVGYRDALDWLQVPGAQDELGQVLQAEGLSPVAGLGWLGRPWQRNRASALVMGAGADAEWLVERMLAAPC
ncbi:MAG: NAD(P)/FAD-dependent oxidoreductase [Pseudomonadota bacterium]|nr:NAD(P)/FAD-dependent oxidoreductase [Pseudomonadota bacterium]